MNKKIATLAVAASFFTLPLFTAPAIAQQSGPGHAHQHGQAQSVTPATETPAMQGMQHGMGHRMGHGMGQMMNCPMMRGGMQMGAPTGDQSVASLALNAVNEKMHRDMAIAFTGDPDADFVAAMIAHHQGAVDMAKVVKAFGADEEILALADAIIEAQEEELAIMREWQARKAAQ
jgi:uncharacterized protein (DUF305 family)